MYLELDSIRTDGGTQTRERLDESAVESYMDAMRAGAYFKSVQVAFDGTHYWLMDGFHRLESRRRIRDSVPESEREDWDTIQVNVHNLSLDSARELAVTYNHDHGVRRTPVDKSKAVKILLACPGWYDRTDEMVARQCGVDRSLVSGVRRAIAKTGGDGNVPSSPVRPPRSVENDRKRERIEKVLAEKPEASSREIAREVGVNHETVSKARKRLAEGKDPVPRAGKRETEPEVTVQSKPVAPPSSDPIRALIAWLDESDADQCLYAAKALQEPFARKGILVSCGSKMQIETAMSGKWPW